MAEKQIEFGFAKKIDREYEQKCLGEMAENAKCCFAKYMKMYKVRPDHQQAIYINCKQF